jgi:site-specific DNA recombinase
VLVVYCLDRLSRDPTHGVILTEELEKYGVNLEAVIENVDNSDLGKLISYIRGFSSKLETEKIRERTIRGRMQRAKEGRQPGGRALYGYDLVEGRHVANEEEAKVVQMVFRYLVNDGMTLRSIQKRLNGMGVLTRKGTAFWQRSVLHRLVREQAYTGEWHYNKTTQRPPKADINSLLEKVKPKDKWVPVSIPAIISRETFDAAQRQLARNAEFCNRNIRRQYLLSGLIRCGKCGYSYNARTLRDTIYYTCNSKLGHVNAVSCESHGVRGDIIEPVVWDCVKELLSQPKLIIEQMEKRDLEMEESGYLQESLKAIGRKLAKKKLQIDKLLEAYTIGAIDAELLKRQMAKVKAEQQKLVVAKQDLKKQLQATANQKLNTDSIEAFCNKISSVFGSLSFTEKRFILREVLDKIVISGDEVTIYGIVPICEDVSGNVSVASQSS